MSSVVLNVTAIDDGYITSGAGSGVKTFRCVH